MSRTTVRATIVAAALSLLSANASAQIEIAKAADGTPLTNETGDVSKLDAEQCKTIQDLVAKDSSLNKTFTNEIAQCKKMADAKSNR